MLTPNLPNRRTKTLAAALTFVLLMAKHPEVQKKAQDELDSVVGIGQLPSFEDKPKLIYIEAILRETMRWLRMVPLGKSRLTILDNLAHRRRPHTIRITARDDGRRYI
jgi:cytochrome P450